MVLDSYDGHSMSESGTRRPSRIARSGISWPHRHLVDVDSRDRDCFQICNSSRRIVDSYPKDSVPRKKSFALTRESRTPTGRASIRSFETLDVLSAVVGSSWG